MEKLGNKKFVVRRITGFCKKLELGITNGNGMILSLGTLIPENGEAEECLIKLFQEMAKSRNLEFCLETWQK
jgi:hypothetical protein